MVSRLRGAEYRLHRHATANADVDPHPGVGEPEPQVLTGLQVQNRGVCDRCRVYGDGAGAPVTARSLRQGQQVQPASTH